MSNNRSVRLAGIDHHCPLHACAFFASQEEENRVLLPFMKGGIEAGDKCVNIINNADREERRRVFAEAGIDVAKAERDGQLELRPWEKAQIAGGHFDLQSVLASFEQAAAKDRNDQRITRLWSNQEWALQGLPGSQDLVECECRFNKIWPKYNDAFVCVYDTTRFSGDVLTNVLRAHPFAIVGGILRANPFFVPPERFLEELRGASNPTPMPGHAEFKDAAGLAALGICELLLLELTDRNVIGERDVRDLLMDVAATHQEAAATSHSPRKHEEVTGIIHRILAGRNGLRH